jgi:hypothetical protein
MRRGRRRRRRRRFCYQTIKEEKHIGERPENLKRNGKTIPIAIFQCSVICEDPVRNLPRKPEGAP